MGLSLADMLYWSLPLRGGEGRGARGSSGRRGACEGRNWPEESFAKEVAVFLDPEMTRKCANRPCKIIRKYTEKDIDCQGMRISSRYAKCGVK